MTDHIQVGNVLPRVQYVANGVQSAFVYPFPAFAAEDLEVYVGASRQAGTYSVSGVGVSVGGSVLFAVPPPLGALVTLRRRLAIQRTTDLETEGVIRARVINNELDYQTAAIQQVSEEAGRAVRRAVTSPSTADLTLPEPQAGRALKWNVDGTALENTTADADQMAAIATQKAAEAAVSAAAAADARTAAEVSAASAAGAAQSTAAAAAAVAGVVSEAGLLQAANNLSELTDPAAARGHLGLGGAATATLDVDTTLAADSDSRVASQKAVRAYVAAHAAPTARLDLLEAELGLLFLGLARLTSSTAPEQGGQEVADEFDDATGVGSLGGAAVTGGCLTNGGASQLLIPQATGAPFGDCTAGGGLAAAFDGVAGQSVVASALKAGTATSCHIGKSWGTGAAKVVSGVKIYASSNEGFQNGSGQTITFTLKGGNSSPNFGGGTNLGSWTAADANSAVTSKLSGLTTSSGYDYHWVEMSSATGADWNISEIEFYYSNVPANIAAVSAAYAAATPPAAVTLVAIWKDVSGTAVANADLTLAVSRDGGTTWATVAMADFGPGPVAGSRVLRGSADISGQPPGTALKWRAETAGHKEQQVHGIWMQWR